MSDEVLVTGATGFIGRALCNSLMTAGLGVRRAVRRSNSKENRRRDRPGLLYSGARLLGREAMIDRLCDSLQVDIGKARQVLGWTPPVSVEEGLERTAQ